MKLISKKITSVLFVVLLALLISGCTTPVQHATPSGKVEAIIKGVTKSTVKEGLISGMIDKGYTVTKSDDNLVSFDRPVDNVMAKMFLGSNYDSTPNARISFNLIQNKGSVRVVADCVIITNPGSAFERRTDVNNNPDTANIQNWLNQVKRDLEKK